MEFLCSSREVASAVYIILKPKAAVGYPMIIIKKGGNVVLKSHKFLFLCSVFACVLLSASCNRYKFIDEEFKPKLPCKVQGACDATVIKYLDALRKRGIKVETIGQQYLISLPASMLFDNQSPHLRWNAYKTLNLVANFIQQFRKVAITVTSFSSPYASPERAYALTEARSRMVSEYLWSQGVDSRFIFTQSMGADKPITSSQGGGDASATARVEITFSRAVLN